MKDLLSARIAEQIPWILTKVSFNDIFGINKTHNHYDYISQHRFGKIYELYRNIFCCHNLHCNHYYISRLINEFDVKFDLSKHTQFYMLPRFCESEQRYINILFQLPGNAVEWDKTAHHLLLLHKYDAVHLIYSLGHRPDLTIDNVILIMLYDFTLFEFINECDPSVFEKVKASELALIQTLCSLRFDVTEKLLDKGMKINDGIVKYCKDTNNYIAVEWIKDNVVEYQDMKLYDISASNDLHDDHSINTSIPYDTMNIRGDIDDDCIYLYKIHALNM